MKQALRLIDIQNDYFCNGNMELVAMEEAAKNAQKLLLRFREEKQSIFHIQHLSIRPQATFFIPNTEGVKTHDLVVPISDEAIIQKHFPNSFRDTMLLEKLKEAEIEEVVICGAMSHMCVDATTRAAFDFGFHCSVIDDACATRDLQFKDKVVEAENVHVSFMAALAVPYAKIISTHDYLTQSQV
ncbi:MAG: isochorismatase [bacterium]|nr:MAG: isochorismatase [bacterium]